MIINVEFLVSEPIENVITNLNFKIDKTIFFGYEEVIKEQKNTIERFLKRHCGVEAVDFYAVSHTDFDAVLDVMRRQLEREYAQGNQMFFDMTGGEPLVLAAFGMLSGEWNAPMHVYDIETGRLIELNTGAGLAISQCAKRQQVNLNLDKYIELRGGRINYRMNKALDSAANEDFEEMMPKLWKVSNENAPVWNAFSDLLKRHSNTEYGLEVDLSAKTVEKYLKESRTLNTERELNSLLEDCQREELLEEVFYGDQGLFFRYKNAFVKECILNTGSILELHTYMEEKRGSTDCLVGIHLDWDGVFRDEGGEDVLNEVDVLVLRGYIPMFISCKNGHVDKEALYELNAVADKFGGKYAKKVLAATRELSRTDLNRAKEMNIEVR